MKDTDGDGGIKDSTDLQGFFQDFHQIFSQSESDHNPEETAFAYFKPHLGNLELQNQVSKGRSVRTTGGLMSVMSVAI